MFRTKYKLVPSIYMHYSFCIKYKKWWQIGWFCYGMWFTCKEDAEYFTMKLNSGK